MNRQQDSHTLTVCKRWNDSLYQTQDQRDWAGMSGPQLEVECPALPVMIHTQLAHERTCMVNLIDNLKIEAKLTI